MKEFEEAALSTAFYPPKWWFRYVDDSHTCLKRDHVNEFHQHLNSINRHIQFTSELENTNGQGLPFLDTITTRCGTRIQVHVYRKPTHTDRYLDFNSHRPSVHKRSVVSTLLLRARNIPSTNKGKREETRTVTALLRGNNYPSSFINECEKAMTIKPTMKGFVVLPYAQGISERIGRLLKQQQIQVFYKPQKNINGSFARPKQQDKTDRPSSGIVYNINCSQCGFVHYGQTERSLKTQVSENKEAVLSFHENSKVPSHVHQCHHLIDFDNVKVVGHEPNYHQRLFLDAWMSVKDTNTGNDHTVIPKVCKCFAHV